MFGTASTKFENVLTERLKFDSLKKFAQKRRNKFEDARFIVLSIQKQPAQAVTVEDL